MDKAQIFRIAEQCKPVLLANNQPVLGDFIIEFAHAIRNQALEDAAKMCDEENVYEKRRSEYDQGAFDAWNNASDFIRAMKGE